MRRSCDFRSQDLENFCIFSHVLAKIIDPFFQIFVPKTPIFQGKSAP